VAGLVEFKVDEKKSKAKFLPDMVIVLTQDGKQITLAERAEVKIENTGNRMLSKLLKVELTLEDEKFKTQMNPNVMSSGKLGCRRAARRRASLDGC
jgi:hypothetical protein